ncbi:hypothetical protein E3T28_07405 [Cryobacterium sinapicolor]|uniref:LGFP repeat-containing protein n=1 Tax=Cryobacterium sinapicolor TaxID=1259236 RepID=A0ABY2JAI3_9MICO|nr:hypothetical protein [Cryobacterium sinapicolor]TFD00917.1 hypothetical protein E3T28_07405 [Cryobacterium sinapicolor]
MRFKRLTGLTLAVALAGALFVSVAPPPAAQAADASFFDPAYIISDNLFFDGAAMSASQVQQFLNERVPTCRIGYVCLKDYRQDTPTRAAVSNDCDAYQGQANESAAQIIAKVGLACGISQKAMIVLLEKEQGIVTDDWPSARQYRSATGYGCPDTADCDTSYYGFFNQVYAAALQFQYYANNPTRWRHAPDRWNAVWYHPNSSCGSSSVYIRNQATAGLYNYTPYQPNQAGLSNLYGSGDTCSSYGNRNFWRMYSDWFGSPIEGPETYIERAYQRAGGSGGYLGAPTTKVTKYTANGGGYVRGYVNGAIAWSTGTTAYVLTGAIRTAYGLAGGITGTLGWPTSDPNSIAANGGGTVQGFQKGAIVSSKAGSWVLSGEIRSQLARAGGVTGDPGWATAAQTCDGAGLCTQPFTGGTFFASPAAGGSFVPTALLGAYTAAGGPAGSLGLPTTAPSTLTVNGGGRVQGFAKGAIAWSSSGGAHVLSGSIRDYYGTVGGIGGSAGWPTSDQLCGAADCSQSFQGAKLYWTTAGQGAYVDARLAGAYDKLGGTSGSTGSLGLPTSGVVALSANGGGVVEAFQNGAIAWSPNGGAHALTGDIRTAFNLAGGIDGMLGWPTGDQVCGDATRCSQTFVGGTLYWSSTQGASIVGTAINGAYTTAGGTTGVLGWPTSGEIFVAANGGGSVQTFEKGAIAASKQFGAYALRGEMRTYYNTLGGLGGTLGWPKSEMTCNAASVCTQTFFGGVLTWTPGTGGTRG